METLEQTLRYKFRNKDLLKLALTHPSHAQVSKKPNQHYQRLEFLGDSVLSFILTDYLYERYPREREGALAMYRAALVQGSFLAKLGEGLGLSEYIILSKAEEKMGGAQKESILEDVVEALIGGIYLDSNLGTTRSRVIEWYGNIDEHLKSIMGTQNPKGRLQELVQKENHEAKLEYQVRDTKGPDHSRQYTIEILVGGKVLAQGTGTSKKCAEEEAAQSALEELKGS